MKTDLFRFVTIRTPEKLSKAKRELGFVEISKPNRSVFLASIDGMTDPNTIRTTLINTANSFTPFSSVQEIKDLTDDLWEFSLWLEQNKYKLVRKTLDSELPTKILTEAKIASLWDNVYYDILTENNPYIRQSCLLLLVAIKFIDDYKNYSPTPVIPKKDFHDVMYKLKRLADGKVVINLHFKNDPKGDNTNYETAISNKKRSQIELFHKSQLLQLDNSNYKDLITDFKAFGDHYENDKTNAYNTAFEAYQVDLRTKIDAFLLANPDLEDDQDLESKIPPRLVNPFSFSFPLPFSEDYKGTTLPELPLKYITDNDLEKSPVQNVIDGLNLRIDENNVLENQPIFSDIKEIVHHGVKIKARFTPKLPFTFSLSNPEILGSSPTKHSVFLSIKTSYANAYLETGSFKITIDGNEVLSKFRIIKSTDQALFLELFDATNISVTQGALIEFEADFKLDNGNEYSVEKKGIASSNYLTGLFPLKPVAIGPEQEFHYGVHRLGIGVLRKVEQEICCYIPGEVSHIENILAREYKEKSSRSLISSQTTFEVENQTEREDLNDTTTTTRHEMNSEIANVLTNDRQQSFGFSTGASGTAGVYSFNANANGNFSFGQSSSQSTNIAKKYAEDVTRRALERVVQKVNTKRTSTILKEFEVNTKHGFDNREGTEHVTGVYRWVDRVYNNQIINYGHKMFYEFMVPEPARFYRDILFSAPELVENTLAPPVTLEDLKISSAADLNAGNYAAVGSNYNTTLTAPEPRNISVTGTLSKAIGIQIASESFTLDGGIMIPPNYVCKSIRSEVYFRYVARSLPNAYLGVAVGNHTFSQSDLSGANALTHVSDEPPFPGLALLNLTGNIPVSITTKKVEFFDLAVRCNCELSPQVYEQWQLDTYSALQNAYQVKLEEYNQAVALIDQQNDLLTSEFEFGLDETNEGNPAFNQEIVLNELKRLCIEMLMRPFGMQQGQDFYHDSRPCPNKEAIAAPELTLNKSLNTYAEQVKFFETAFDWELMSEAYYPYYWAKRCEWSKLVGQEPFNDQKFNAFLKAGMVRILVVAREGYAASISFFMQTGQIWDGVDTVVETDDEYFMSVLEDINLDVPFEDGDSWETTVPSTLTIVQADSAGLDVSGLPCCHVPDEETTQEEIDAGNPINPNKNIMAWKVGQSQTEEETP